MLVGTAKHLGTEERDQLTIEAMSTEALTTSEIREKRGTDLAQYDLQLSNSPTNLLSQCARLAGSWGACLELWAAIRFVTRLIAP